MLKERNSLFSLSFFFKNFWIEEEGRARSIDRWPEEMGGGDVSSGLYHGIRALITTRPVFNP